MVTSQNCENPKNPMISIFKAVDECYNNMYSARLKGVIFSVATFNALAILISLTYSDEGLASYDPVKWIVVGALTGLFIFEVRKSRNEKRQLPSS